MTLDLKPDSMHPSRHQLTRYHAGELGSDQADQLAGHIQACRQCQTVMQELQAADIAFKGEMDRDDFIARVRLAARNGHQQQGSRDQQGSQAATRPSHVRPDGVSAWGRLLGARLLGAAAAMVLIVTVAVLGPGWWANNTVTPLPGTGSLDDIRFKGGDLELGLLVRRAGEVGHVGEMGRAAPERVLHPGDRIQFTLTAPAGRFLHLVSVDAAGTVSVYFPLPDITPAAFPGGAGRPVPGSIVLDTTLGLETVFALLCDRPLGRGALTAALENWPDGALSLQKMDAVQADTLRRLLPTTNTVNVSSPPMALDCWQTSLKLHKESK